ncbi:hypothetical protein PS627_04594 [Pseudomonas fluorescens]|nr:hypothetical protein PS627_04594 [Pseudomonas fluorescens]
MACVSSWARSKASSASCRASRRHWCWRARTTPASRVWSPISPAAARHSPWRSMSCALRCWPTCRAIWCRAPLSALKPGPSPPTARSTAARLRCLRARRCSVRPTKRRKDPLRRRWPRYGANCCRSSGWGGTTTSSNWAGIRCWRSRWSRACVRWACKPISACCSPSPRWQPCRPPWAAVQACRCRRT